MVEQLTPTPEGNLIKNARERAGLTIRKAARMAKISEGRWRQIEKGYATPAQGQTVSARGSALYLARMAQVVHVTPAELEKVGRADAAEKLRNLDDSHAAITRRSGDLYLRIDRIMSDPEARRMLESCVSMVESHHGF